MKNAPQVESENVIKISFGSRIDHEIAHPASKNFPETLGEDPLQDLLAEGEYEELEDYEDQPEEENYIHAHQDSFKYTPSFCDPASDLASATIERLLRLKEDAKRLRYYLDELNID